MRTPEFVRWTIACPCPLRAISDERSPEQTERLLRPLREISRAMVEGRVRDGIALERLPLGSDDAASRHEPLAFRVEDCLAGRGDVDAINALCSTCPANATRALSETLWAGCYGELPREASGVDLAMVLEEAIEGSGLDEQLAQAFPVTSPRWYGLWIEASPSESQRVLLARLFALPPALKHNGPAQDFAAALAASLTSRLPLCVSLSPAGELTDTAWTVAAHCPRCHTERPMRRGVCPACGECNHALPAKQRKRRGIRPYRPLASILGPIGAAEYRRRDRDLKAP